MLLIILLQMKVELGGAYLALATLGAAIVGFIIAYVYLKTGIESKVGEGYKKLYDLEKERATKYETLYKAEQAEHNILKIDYEAVSLEYGQLSELFAKKSLVLEAFTNQYGGAAKAIEHLISEGKLALPKKTIEQNIHSTSGGELNK